MALATEARRLADALCLHWEDTGDEQCVPEVTGWLPEGLVGNLAALADQVEAAWHAAQHRGAAQGDVSIPGALSRAQTLLSRLQQGLVQRFRTMEPPEPSLLEAFAETGPPSDWMGGLTDALRQRVQVARQHRAFLEREGLIDSRWLDEADGILKELEPQTRPESQGERQALAVRLSTLMLRLESLLLVARRAASAYSVNVGFEA
mgnify:CR=1 FL=1